MTVLSRLTIASMLGILTLVLPAFPTGAAVPPANAATVAAEAVATSVQQPTVYAGKAFDTCSAPAVDTMSAWRSSPYGAIGVYVGGINRGCAQPHLTADWVDAVHLQGWHLLPVYVGLQAPCAKTAAGKPFAHRISTNGTTAANQGTSAASDAVAAMQSLGLSAGNPVYLDMESWPIGKAACTASVMAFADAWTAGLHSAGYHSGFYSSANTGVAALVAQIQRQSQFHAPDAVWFGRWDGKAVTVDPAIPSTMWTGHRRIKQYAGPHDENHGGKKLNIDSDVVDGPVTGLSVDLSTAALPTAVAGKAYSADITASGARPPYRFSVASGSLPAGLHLSSKGVLSGRATKAGLVSTFTVRATDASRPAFTATRPYSIYVTFTDMLPGQPFYSAITWLSKKHIATGYPNGTFRPSIPVTRQVMATFLYRFANPGKYPPACTKKPFTDIAADSVFCRYIAWLKQTHIATGYPDGTFRPTSPVTRQVMATYLYRYANPGKYPPACTKKPFTDIAADSVFCRYIAWLKQTHIATGYPDGTFRPTSAVTRAVMAEYLRRLYTP